MKSAESQTKVTWSHYLLLATLVLLTVVAKAMPYILNQFYPNLDPADPLAYIWGFSPLFPLAIVAGAALPAWAALTLPVAAMFGGDLLIGIVSGHMEWAFYEGQMTVLLLMAAIAGIGMSGRAFRQDGTLAGRCVTNLVAGLAGATFFFLISNFLVWVSAGEVVYARTLGGLLECYTMAVPFYRNSLVSMLLYVPIITALLNPFAAQRESREPSGEAGVSTQGS